MPYWITDSLAGMPAFLWIYVVLGGLWSLVVLPRAEWRRRVQVTAVAFALGPMLLTAWMLVLGMIGAANGTALLTDLNVNGGTVVLALIGLVLVVRKWRQPISAPVERHPLLADERLLILLVVAALVVRWIITAYWPFTAYDALWVYGYEGRLYALLGYIPQRIGYYPQFLPLQFTYAQLGGISDHAARAVLPFLHVGSILATYVLGSRLINRRTGIIAAAIWALYPHVGEWARMGDLEIPLAFAFTLAAAFFLLAWIGQEPRRRYALIAGLLLGVGMWIKPTMGAFILGVGLLVLIDGVRVGFDFARWRPRFEVALLTGIAAAPLGGVWYVRNLLLGHAAVIFPTPYWQTLAQRSGREFGWLLVALIAWAILMLVRYPRYRWRVGGAGLALVLLALVPSILSPRRLTWIEFILLGAGGILLAINLRRAIRDLWDDDLRATAAKVGWGLALALPYFLTWFYSYSYHYRLVFAIVPLMILPTAVVLERLLTPGRIGRGARRLAYLAVIVLIGYPGIIAAVGDLNGGVDYLWTDKYPDDTARYRSGNAALMNVVDGLNIWHDEHPGERLVVAAPSLDRLPFFFPLDDIRVDDAPTRLAQLEGVDYFIYATLEAQSDYESVPPTENQVLGALDRKDIMRRAWGMDDGIFRYDVYELHLDNRWVAPTPNGLETHDVVIGGFARYIGYDIGGLDLWSGRKVIAHLYWQVVAPPTEDYSIMIHLQDSAGNLIASWDGPVAKGEHGYYSTLVWEPGEYISDERTIKLPDDVDAVGQGYRLVIGIYNTVTGERLPVTVDGAAAGTDYQIENRINLLAQPPG